MGHAMHQPLSSKKEKVILYLWGIDKKWIRDNNNQWVEYREEAMQEEVVTKRKKWWQFWKRE